MVMPWEKGWYKAMPIMIKTEKTLNAETPLMFIMHSRINLKP